MRRRRGRRRTRPQFGRCLRARRLGPILRGRGEHRRAVCPRAPAVLRPRQPSAAPRAGGRSRRGPPRLSQAISEGDGISLIVAVRDADEAQRAEAGGAEALLAEDALEAIRASSALPIVTSAGSSGDARIVCPGDEEVELVVQVEREEELDEALERFDPELFVLAAPDGDDDQLEHVLDLLSDLPAGKLAIADLRGATQPEIDELERAGIDAVLVRELP